MLTILKRKITYLFIVLLFGGVGALYYSNSVMLWVDLLYTPNDPAAVANDFWKVVLSQDELEAERFVLAPKSFSELIPGYNTNDRVRFTSVEQNRDAYFIKTNLTLFRAETYAFPLFTVVRSKGGKFKVDVPATILSVPDAMLVDVSKYYKTTANSASKMLLGQAKAGGKEAFSEYGKLQVKTTLCEMASDLTMIISGKSDQIFSECSVPQKSE